MTETNHHEYLLWLDMETTGLWAEADYPLEIAWVLTKADALEELQSGIHLIDAPKMALDRMNDYVRKMHTDNGLLELLAAGRRYGNPFEDTFAGREHVNLWMPEEVGNLIIDVLKKVGAAPMQVVLTGNTIHFDRRFIARLMPHLHEFLHYRMLDVSAVRHALRIYAPARAAEVARIMAEKDGSSKHRAMGDVHASIEEMRIYKRWLSELPALDDANTLGAVRELPPG